MKRRLVKKVYTSLSGTTASKLLTVVLLISLNITNQQLPYFVFDEWMRVSNETARSEEEAHWSVHASCRSTVLLEPRDLHEILAGPQG